MRLRKKEIKMKTERELIQQLKGRAEFCRDRGEVKTPELLERAVKALEQREGYKLVPVQCPDPDFADMLFDELSKKAIGEFGDDLLIHFSDIDEEKIWALMVEAAKAQLQKT